MLDSKLKLQVLKNKKGNMVIEQKQARQLRIELLDYLINLISNDNNDCTITKGATGGFYIEIPNEYEGAIIANVDISIKPLDTDLLVIQQEYEQKQEQKKNTKK